MPVFPPQPRGLHILSSRIPYFLWLWQVGVTYTIVWEFAVQNLILGEDWGKGAFFDNDGQSASSRPRVAAGVFIIIVSLAFRLNWNAAWLWCLWITHAKGTNKWHRNPVTTPKRVMHSDWGVRCLMGDDLPPPNQRFRKCGMCSDTTGYGDRTYHCHSLHRHLPVYDHFCYWLGVAVYLDTIKAYLLLIISLLADGTFVVIFSIAAASYTKGLAYLHILTACLSSIWVCYLAFGQAGHQIYYLAVKDCTGPEQKMSQWTLAVTKAQSRGHPGPTVSFVRLIRTEDDRRRGINRTPWSLSDWENLRAVLGERVWTWPLFWIQPARVSKYGRYPGNQSDLPLGELFLRFDRDPDNSPATRTYEFDIHPRYEDIRSRRAINRSRTSHASRASRSEESSGFELVELA